MGTNPNLGRGAPLPPPQEKPWWKVIAPVNQGVLGVTILDDTWTGYPLHYMLDLNKNLPCAKPNHCWMCHRGSVARWSGYLSVQRNHPPAFKILALTPFAAFQLKPVLEKRGTLRGLMVDLQRRPQHANAAPKKNDPVWVKFKGYKNEETLPPAFDVLNSLERMWGCNLAFFSAVEPNFGSLGLAPGELGPDVQPLAN